MLPQLNHLLSHSRFSIYLKSSTNIFLVQSCQFQQEVCRRNMVLYNLPQSDSLHFFLLGWLMAGIWCLYCEEQLSTQSMSSCFTTVVFTYTLCGGTRRTVSTKLLSQELSSVYGRAHLSNTFFLGLQCIVWHKEFAHGFKVRGMPGRLLELRVNIIHLSSWMKGLGSPCLPCLLEKPLSQPSCLSFCYLIKAASHGKLKSFFHIFIKKKVSNNLYLLKSLEKLQNVRNHFTLSI